MSNIHILIADETIQTRIRHEWGEIQARHMHLTDGFSLVALEGDQLAGLISICWKLLPPPLPDTCEAFIDIIEVHADFRHRGIATQLVDAAIEKARVKGAYQIRAWSSDNKIEAIPMWKYLGFGLCPTTTYHQGQEIHGYFVAKTL